MRRDKHSGPSSMPGIKRRYKISGQFAPRLIEMLESYAYRALSLSAHRVLARLEIELAGQGGAKPSDGFFKNQNGKLKVTFGDFQAYGIDRHSIAPAIRLCEALGFIQVTERGRAGNADYRTPNLYRLTYVPADGVDHDGSHEWRSIKTDEQAEENAEQSKRVCKTVSKKVWSKKQKASGGVSRVPVGKTPTGTVRFPVGKTPTENAKSPVGKTPTTLYSLQGSGGRASRIVPHVRRPATVAVAVAEPDRSRQRQR
jgi:hypothetical protein